MKRRSKQYHYALNGHSSISYTMTRKAVIAGGGLVVCISREYDSMAGTADDLTAFIGVLSAKPCGHVYEDLPTLKADEKTIDGSHTPGSCGTCLTDWEVRICRRYAPGVGHEVKSGWTVSMVSFHDLGDCRSPDEWKWMDALALRSQYDLCRKPGSVRRKWGSVPYGTLGSEPERCATEFFPWSYVPVHGMKECRSNQYRWRNRR